MRGRAVLRLAEHTLRLNLGAAVVCLLVFPAVYLMWRLGSGAAPRSFYSIASKLQIVTAVIFGVLAASHERREGTLRFLLAQPIGRDTVVFGELVSLAAFGLLNSAIPTAILVVEAARADMPIRETLAFLVLTFGFLRPLVIASVAFLLASITSPWVSGAVALALPIVYGLVADGFFARGEFHRTVNRLARWVLPSLDQLDLYRCLALNEAPALIGSMVVCLDSLSFIGLMWLVALLVSQQFES